MEYPTKEHEAPHHEEVHKLGKGKTPPFPEKPGVRGEVGVRAGGEGPRAPRHIKV